MEYPNSVGMHPDQPEIHNDLLGKCTELGVYTYSETRLMVRYMVSAPGFPTLLLPMCLFTPKVTHYTTPSGHMVIMYPVMAFISHLQAFTAHYV